MGCVLGSVVWVLLVVVFVVLVISCCSLWLLVGYGLVMLVLLIWWWNIYLFNNCVWVDDVVYLLCGEVYGYWVIL